ncbi:hypothetical protein [Acidithiobacillus acidisediminis]|uniref:hypothetical protein n=1 Tax=Acidithiobacillus acidisediminis TaxID=2937799 RepID=UPI00200DD690|nr:hypothetical protein [Acidithiobacillus sp. S30A2]
MEEQKDFPTLFRVVGRRQPPEDHIYPLDTPEQREAYYAHWAKLTRRNAALRPARILQPGEPRVKRFRTLEEANADQEEAMMRVMEWMQRRGSKEFPG